MTIAFIGLGIMGSRMATNLLKSGANVTVYNRSQEPVDKLVAVGARAASSANEAVKGADLVLSMLSTPEVVEQVVLAKGGALHAMKKDSIWVDCSTVHPSFSRQSAQAAQEAGVRFMDAPVAGTKPHAQNAELVFFAGGDQALLDEVQPYLDTMGRKIVHVGETGQGASFKMLVNMMLAQSMVIFSEAVILGEQLGMSKEFLLNTIPNLVVAAPFTKFKADMLREDNYDVQFPLEWMHKDLHLAAVSAYEVQQPLYLANATKELFAAAVQEGMGRLDFAAIHRFLENKS